MVLILTRSLNGTVIFYKKNSLYEDSFFSKYLKTNSNKDKKRKSTSVFWRSRLKTTENVYNSQTSYRATAYKAPAEEVSIVDCIKSASLSREEMYEVILQVVDTFENKDLKTICKNLHNKNKKELLLAGVILHNIGN